MEQQDTKHHRLTIETTQRRTYETPRIADGGDAVPLIQGDGSQLFEAIASYIKDVPIGDIIK